MKHVIDSTDLTVEEIDGILKLAQDIIDDKEAYSEACKGKKLATLFFEPSTRTRLSFESAMMELGGNVLGFSSADSTSATKGESVGDTTRVVSCYADIIATLTDLLTILREKGRLDNFTIGLCGDLKFGRTVHSLIKALSRYENIKFILIAPKELRVPEYIISEVLEAKNIPYEEVESMEEVMSELDVLYMTRVQKERFFNEADYVRLKDTYILDGKKLKNAKSDLAILHPLPRVNEISVEIDDDPRACYFRQVMNGKFVRMALMLTLLKANGAKLNLSADKLAKIPE